MDKNCTFFINGQFLNVCGFSYSDFSFYQDWNDCANFKHLIELLNSYPVYQIQMLKVKVDQQEILVTVVSPLWPVLPQQSKVHFLVLCKRNDTVFCILTSNIRMKKGETAYDSQIYTCLYTKTEILALSMRNQIGEWETGDI